MRGDKTALEQLHIGPTGTSNTWGAWLDGKLFAQFNGCPSGVAVRWLFLDYPKPHWNTIHADHDAAIEYIRLWVSGLDIIPWDELGSGEAAADSA
ncbi:MAG: hypothetical protein J0I77_09555 [Rudaea sp.]|uniref:hypothetical protein n=1 Tax=unclassified Rudaea TaxID=2627037 RepID=UPI0010F87ACB|nr:MULTISPECIES: hypothetical protein [unclassified Rudaea]MBN8885953.1 hypothetical protein [Rudaea sp.]MBR0347043.1 hypothetical protein [Rudaea sp.]